MQGSLQLRLLRSKGASVGEWRSLVAHLFWEQRVAGSNPVSPTTRVRTHALSAIPDTATAFKILTAPQWQALEAGGVFQGAPVDLADGFIHLSTADQLDETLRKHFAGQHGLVIAEIDLAGFGDALRWEVSRGGALFPHLYAPLPLSAVKRIVSR
jgi:uncharacterized protein (DUF952 family)